MKGDYDEKSIRGQNQRCICLGKRNYRLVFKDDVTGENGVLTRG